MIHFVSWLALLAVAWGLLCLVGTLGLPFGVRCIVVLVAAVAMNAAERQFDGFQEERAQRRRFFLAQNTEPTLLAEPASLDGESRVDSSGGDS